MLSSTFLITPSMNMSLVFMLNFLFSLFLVQILIAKGASLTSENANGYAFTSYDFIVVSNGNCFVSHGCNLYSSVV